MRDRGELGGAHEPGCDRREMVGAGDGQHAQVVTELDRIAAYGAAVEHGDVLERRASGLSTWPGRSG